MFVFLFISSLRYPGLDRAVGFLLHSRSWWGRVRACMTARPPDLRCACAYEIIDLRCACAHASEKVMRQAVCSWKSAARVSAFEFPRRPALHPKYPVLPCSTCSVHQAVRPCTRTLGARTSYPLPVVSFLVMFSLRIDKDFI